jgi:DNA-binding LytR/AlgR family response regulator
MNCIAVDDEPFALSLLADNIGKVPFLNLLDTCDDGISATKALAEHNIDLIFIDIQMPGLTGLQFIKTLVKKPLVIIVSAYKEYAMDGFALHVVDYLTKPVPLDRFMEACNRAKELFELQALQKTANSNVVVAKHTYLNVGYSVLKIAFDEVLYIEGLKDYVKIYFATNRKPAVARVSFKQLESKWPADFMRIHKSFIINRQKIDAVTKTSVFINESELPIGEVYRQTLNNFIGGYTG